MANSKKRCKYCKKYFPSETMVSPPAGTFCTIEHAAQWASEERDKKLKSDKAWQREFKEKTSTPTKAKEHIKTTSQRKQEAQKAFNAFIRYRDKDKDCISCDRPISEIEGRDGWKPGGAWDCGHFLTVGAHEELRFEELNAHRQCKSCNGGAGNFTGKEKTVSNQYREKLIERIGLDNVLWLEGPHEPKRYRDEDYDRIKKTYRAKLRELKKAEL